MHQKQCEVISWEFNCNFCLLFKSMLSQIIKLWVSYLKMNERWVVFEGRSPPPVGLRVPDNQQATACVCVTPLHQSYDVLNHRWTRWTAYIWKEKIFVQSSDDVLLQQSFILVEWKWPNEQKKLIKPQQNFSPASSSPALLHALSPFLTVTDPPSSMGKLRPIEVPKQLPAWSPCMSVRVKKENETKVTLHYISYQMIMGNKLESPQYLIPPSPLCWRPQHIRGFHP